MLERRLWMNKASQVVWRKARYIKELVSTYCNCGVGAYGGEWIQPVAGSGIRFEF